MRKVAKGLGGGDEELCQRSQSPGTLKVLLYCVTSLTISSAHQLWLTLEDEKTDMQTRKQTEQENFLKRFEQFRFNFPFIKYWSATREVMRMSN